MHLFRNSFYLHLWITKSFPFHGVFILPTNLKPNFKPLSPRLNHRVTSNVPHVFESVDDILRTGYSGESSSTVLYDGSVC